MKDDTLPGALTNERAPSRNGKRLPPEKASHEPGFSRCAGGKPATVQLLRIFYKKKKKTALETLAQ